MPQSASDIRPVTDADRCVHDLTPQASCRRCASACPHDALALTDQALTFDEEACTGCGHCRAACPDAAISLPGPTFSPVVDKDTGDAYLACTRAIPQGGAGTLPCLHALGEHDLTRYADDGAPRLHLARGACADCPQRAVVTIEDHAAAVNRLRASRGCQQLVLVDETAPCWRHQVAAISVQGRKLDATRRALFAGFFRQPAAALQKTVPEDLARYAPLIDAAACSGCDACARICPHGAISLSRDEHGLHYATAPRACTGCGLCSDLCQDGAVRVGAFAPAGPVRVALVERRCTRCGVPFHEPEGTRSENAGDGRCRICRTHRHPAKLFEVRS